MIIRRDIVSMICVLVAIFLGSHGVNAQNRQDESTLADQYLSTLPADLTLQEDDPQIYRLTTIWHNRDPYGNATGKYVIRGDYTRALPADTVRWNNITIEVFSDPAQPESGTRTFEALEGFSYKSPNDLVRLDLFVDFPSDDSQYLLKTLVWDAVAFETFGWNYFDQLKLNQPVLARDLESLDVNMDSWGNFKMQNLKLTWTGISKMNDEICALIQYESFANPVIPNSFVRTANGRSLYWGSIWISLEDKQIEYATMNEDVIMEIAAPPNFEKKLLNIQREVKFNKEQ